MTPNRLMVLGILVVGVSLLVACKGEEEKGNEDKTPLTYQGSSTIADNILTEAVPAFEKETGIKFSKLSSDGSGEGFKATMNGSADIGGLSRRITEEEKKQEIYHQIIGYDALTVFVHVDNPLDGITRTQLSGIFTGAITNWSELGGADVPIEPVTELLDGMRATNEVFEHLALEDAKFGKVTQVDRPRDCVAYIDTHPNAIAFAALAFKTDKTKGIPVDGIAPTNVNVQSGAYLLSRPLILISKEVPKGSAKAFFEFMLSPKGQAIVAKKFVSVSQ